jgi:hypothetical protein
MKKKPHKARAGRGIQLKSPKRRPGALFRRAALAGTLLLGTALFLGLALLSAFMYFNAAPPAVSRSPSAPGLSRSAPEGVRSEGGEVYLEVRKGESAQSVGLRLEQAALIRNRHFW